MTLQLMISKQFPIDILILMAVAFTSGFFWAGGTWLWGRVVK